MGLLSVCMSVCLMHSVPIEARRWRQVLQTWSYKSCRVGTEDWTQVLCKSSMCSSSRSHLFSPLLIFLLSFQSSLCILKISSLSDESFITVSPSVFGGGEQFHVSDCLSILSQILFGVINLKIIHQIQGYLGLCL